MLNSLRLMRDSVIRIAGSAGIHIGKRTDVESLRDLIKSLRPVGDTRLIRLGPDSDGGYLIPDDLQGIDFAFSPGVSVVSGFEADLARRGMRVFLADLSVDGPAQSDARFTFDKKFVGCLSNDEFMTLEDWVHWRIGGHEGDLLLQMDIEGAEFETLINAPSKLLAQFRIIVVEFHYLDQLFNRPFFLFARRAFERLLQTHSVVHIHPNNCCGSVQSGGVEIPRIAEFTFHRNGRIRSRVPRRSFPHELDRDNNSRPPLALPCCWYE